MEINFNVSGFIWFMYILTSFRKMVYSNHVTRLNLIRHKDGCISTWMCLNNENLLEVKFEDTNNYRKNDEIIIGDEARKFIGNAKDNYLKISRVQEFYRDVKMFYVESCRYLIDKLQMNEELKVRAEVAYAQLRLSSSFSDIRYFLERFPILVLVSLFLMQLLVKISSILSHVYLLCLHCFKCLHFIFAFTLQLLFIGIIFCFVIVISFTFLALHLGIHVELFE